MVIQPAYRSSSATISGLDLVRFSAAVMVMVFHLAFWRNGVGPIRTGFDVTPYSWFGWVGVQIFFVLSGYVIAFSAKNTNSINFLRSRFLRLAPCIWISATLTLIFLLLGGAERSDLVIRYVKTLFLYPMGGQLDIVYWTLTIEVVFYALVYLILRLFEFKALIVVMACVGVLSSAFIFLLTTHSLQLIQDFSLRHVSRLLLLHHGVFFAAGVFIWALQNNYRNWYLKWILALCLVAGSVEIIHETMVFEGEKGVSGAVASYVPLVTWLLAVVLITLVARFNHIINRVLGNNVATIRFLGLLTFPLYLIHNNNGNLIQKWLFSNGVSIWAALVFSIAASIAISIMVVAFIEPPLRRRLAGLLPIGPNIGAAQTSSRPLDAAAEG